MHKIELRFMTDVACWQSTDYECALLLCSFNRPRFAVFWMDVRQAVWIHVLRFIKYWLSGTVAKWLMEVAFEAMDLSSWEVRVLNPGLVKARWFLRPCAIYEFLIWIGLSQETKFDRNCRVGETPDEKLQFISHSLPSSWSISAVKQLSLKMANHAYPNFRFNTVAWIYREFSLKKKLY